MLRQQPLLLLLRSRRSWSRKRFALLLGTKSQKHFRLLRVDLKESLLQGIRGRTSAASSEQSLRPSELPEPETSQDVPSFQNCQNRTLPQKKSSSRKTTFLEGLVSKLETKHSSGPVEPTTFPWSQHSLRLNPRRLRQRLCRSFKPLSSQMSFNSLSPQVLVQSQELLGKYPLQTRIEKLAKR